MILDSGWGGSDTVPGTQTIPGTQCNVDAVHSTVSLSNTDLTLNVKVNFNSSFIGRQSIFMVSSDYSNAQTPPQQMGYPWTAYAMPCSQPPSADSVSPGSAIGSRVAFAYQGSSCAGYAAIPYVYGLINPTASTANGCYAVYNRAGGYFVLLNDAGTGWSGWGYPGSQSPNAPVGNTQCTLYPATSSASGSNQQLTVNMDIGFATVFGNTAPTNKNNYLKVADRQQDSGWVQRGTWMLTSPPPDFSLGLSPASATVTAGNSVSYTVTTSATNGFNRSVTLTAVALPSGITGTFSPATITGSGSSTLTTNVPSASTAATYTITANGSSGSLSRNATASLSVQASTTGTVPPDCYTSFWGDSRIVMVTPNDAYAYAETWSIDPGASHWTNYVTGTLKRGTTTINGPQDAAPTSGTTHANVSFPDFDPTLPSGTYVMTGEHWKLSPDCQPGVTNYGQHFFDAFKLSVPEVQSVSPSPSYGVTGSFTTIDAYGVGLSGVDGAQVSAASASEVRFSSRTVFDDTHVRITIQIPVSAQASTTPRSVTLTASNPNEVTDNSNPSSPMRRTINTPVNANPFNFYVSDPSPVIAGVQQLGPLYPGDPAGAYIVIYGTHFGSGQGTLGFCLQGTPDPCASSDISSNIQFWGTNSQGYSQVNAFLTATSTAAFGDYDVQLTAATGAIGMSFQPAPGGQTKPTTRGRPVRVTPKASTVKLIQFGLGNNQELWKATTFGSNGDSQIGPVVWSDPNGDGNVTINEPAALQAGSDAPYLSNIVLRTDPGVSAMAELQVVVVQTGFVFPSLSFQFVNGQATIANMNLGGPIPRQISNATYDFQWKIRFSPTSTFQTFQTFKTTSHRLYLMHGLFDAGSTGYRATTKRLDYVTGLAQDLSDVTAIVFSLQQGLKANPNFDGTSHLPPQYQNNVWAALDSPPPPQFMGYDCESVSGIAIAQLQQLGYSTPQLGRAYPTGAKPPGDTDATTPESQFVVADVYSLAYAEAGITGLRGNFFEGFLYLSPPDTPSLTAYTVFPWSMGALGFTACDVVPTSAENLIAFRVLTSTYRITGVPYQYWLWDPRVNTGPQPENPQFGQIPLPATCPAAANEYP